MDGWVLRYNAFRNKGRSISQTHPSNHPDIHTYKTKLKLDKEVGGGGGPARERENRTRELEEPASGPSRRPALEAPQPQTGGGSARERENGTRGREEPASDPT